MECAADAEERKRHFEGAIVDGAAFPLGALVELGHDRFVNRSFGEHPLDKNASLLPQTQQSGPGFSSSARLQVLA